MSATYPTKVRVYAKVIEAGSGFTDPENIVYVTSPTLGIGRRAVSTQIDNLSSHTIRVKINGNADAVYAMPAGVTQVFHAGDLFISKLQFSNASSGATASDIQVMVTG